MKPSEQARIAEGATAEVFAWGAGQILKLYRPGYPADEAEQEARRARAVFASGVRTPAVVDVVTLEDRPGVVFERVEGPTMLEVVLAHPDRIVAMAEAMAELHAAIHNSRVSGLPLQRERLRRKIHRARGLTADAAERALMALDRLPESEALCHGDFHPGNILVTERELVVIDWVDSTQGHPLADVARTRLLLLHGSLPGSLSEAMRSRIEGLRQQLWAAYRHRYAQLRPYAPEELDAWLPPVAAARLSEPIASSEEADALVDLASDQVYTRMIARLEGARAPNVSDQSST